MSDRIAVMNGGRVEQAASPKAIYEEPDTVFVADFLGVSNLLGATAIGQDGAACTVQVGDRTLRARQGATSARRGQGDDPARAHRGRAPRQPGRGAPAGDGRAVGLPGRRVRGPRPRARRRAAQGDGAERRRDLGVRPGSRARPSACTCRPTPCACSQRAGEPPPPPRRHRTRGRRRPGGRSRTRPRGHRTRGGRPQRDERGGEEGQGPPNPKGGPPGGGRVAAAGCGGGAGGPGGTQGGGGVDRATIAGRVVTTIGGQTENRGKEGDDGSAGLRAPGGGGGEGAIKFGGHQTLTLQADTPVSVSVAVTGLARDTAYHYSLCAKDSEAGVCGAKRTFRTQDVVCGQTVTADVTLTGAPRLQLRQPGSLRRAQRARDRRGWAGHRSRRVRHPGTGLPGWRRPIRHRQLGWPRRPDRPRRRPRRLGRRAPPSRASWNLMHHLHAQGAQFGVSITGGSDNEFRGGDVSGRLNAIKTDGQTGLVVANTTVTFGVAGGPALSIGGKRRPHLSQRR